VAGLLPTFVLNSGPHPSVEEIIPHHFLTQFINNNCSKYTTAALTTYAGLLAACACLQGRDGCLNMVAVIKQAYSLQIMHPIAAVVLLTLLCIVCMSFACVTMLMKGC
jgi:hypothetical protein